MMKKPRVGDTPKIASNPMTYFSRLLETMNGMFHEKSSRGSKMGGNASQDKISPDRRCGPSVTWFELQRLLMQGCADLCRLWIVATQ